jgi:hypothetical protein
MAGSVSGGSGNDTVTNSGVLAVINLSLGDGTNHLTNSGLVIGGVVCGSGADTVMDFTILSDGSMKSGTISASVFLGALMPSALRQTIPQARIHSSSIRAPI